MVLRNFSIAQVVALVSVFSLLVTATSAENYSHPGQVLERGSNAPLEAQVTVWKSPNQTGNGRCPQHGDKPIDAKVSSRKSGQFEIGVPSEVGTYTVVYCANGYHSRVDRNLPNTTKGSRVIPTPARLRKQSDDPNALTIDTIQRRVVFSLNELAYLQQIDSKLFERAMTQYRELVSAQDPRANEVLAGLPAMIAIWGEHEVRR